MYQYFKKLKGYELSWIKKVPYGSYEKEPGVIEITEEEFQHLSNKLFSQLEDE